MPLFSVGRFFATLLSLAILAAAIYLLWSWRQGYVIVDALGRVHHEHEGWRLGAGLALMAWSFLGRLVMVPLLARPNGRRSSAEHGQGRIIQSPRGSSIYVESVGPASAPAIILTHGWGMDSTFWNQAKQDLGDRFRLTVWDLPGLGKSRAPARGGVSLDGFAQDLATVIETSGAQRPLLVGHSIGGMTIQTLLGADPQMHRKLAGVVLLNTTYTNPLKTMIFSGLMQTLQKPVLEPAMKLVNALQPLVWLMNWQSYLSGSAHLASRLGFGKFVTRSQLDHATLLSTRNSPGVQAQGNLAMFHWDATGALEGSPLPVLVVGGDKDIVTKLEANRAIAAETDLGVLRVVTGVNHMGPLERADLYDQLIAEFALYVDRSPSADASAPKPAPEARTGDRSGQSGRGAYRPH